MEAWRTKWQPTPVFLPGKSHEQRSLASYSPWGCKRVGHDLPTKQRNILYFIIFYKIYFIILSNTLLIILYYITY